MPPIWKKKGTSKVRIRKLGIKLTCHGLKLYNGLVENMLRSRTITAVDSSLVNPSRNVDTLTQDVPREAHRKCRELNYE